MNIWDGAFKSMVNKAKTAIDSVTPVAVTNAIDTVSTAAEKSWQAVSESSIGQAVGSVTDSVVDHGKAVGNSVGQAVTDGTNVVTKKVNGAIKGFRDAE